MTNAETKIKQECVTEMIGRRFFDTVVKGDLSAKVTAMQRLGR